MSTAEEAKHNKPLFNSALYVIPFLGRELQVHWAPIEVKPLKAIVHSTRVSERNSEHRPKCDANKPVNRRGSLKSPGEKYVLCSWYASHYNDTT